MMSFEKYLRTGCHPLGWEEAICRLAPGLSWVLFVWLIAESVVAHFPIWHRIVCLIASFAVIWITDEVYWGAVVRY
jgi:hypothetical protein